VVDFNPQGIQFAKSALGFRDSAVVDDVYGYTPSEKVRFVSLVHSLEHLDDPIRLLRHLKSEVLSERGFLYIEVPNLYGSPLNDPTHFFTYSKESLRYLLNTSGYEVVSLTTGGNPHAPLTIANDELVLVCMARSVSEPPTPTLVPGTEIGSQVQKRYRQLSRRAILRQFRKSYLEFARAIYYSFGHFVLERITDDLFGTLRKLKRITKLRLH